jgi:HD-like signal output (HDOD) protein
MGPVALCRGNSEQARAAAFSAFDKMPVFSPVLGRLVASLGDESVSYSHLAALIEKDTILTGHLLRLVNSAIYSRGREVNSVPRAISIVGISRLRNFAVSLLVARMWTRIRLPETFSLARFNLHGAAVAIAADLLALNTPVEYAEGAFTAGLLHDVGKVLVAVALPEEYDLLNRAGAWEAGLEAELLGATHAELSGAVLEHWRLPPQICQAAALHHSPPPGATGLAHLVKAADDFSKTAGAAESQPSGDPRQALSGVLPESEIEPFMDRFQAEFDALRQFF